MDQDRQIRLLLVQLPGKSHAVLSRKTDVDDGQVRQPALDYRLGFLCCQAGRASMPGLGEEEGQIAGKRLAIFNDEDVTHRQFPWLDAMALPGIRNVNLPHRGALSNWSMT